MEEGAAELAGRTGGVMARAGVGGIASRTSAVVERPRPLVRLGDADIGVIRSDARSAPFFAAAARGELMIKRCGGCARWLGPAVSSCPDCGADTEGAWAVASGLGTLVSWAVVHSREGGSVAVPALVELDEGPWLATGLSLPEPAALAALQAGQTVEVAFAMPADGECYPIFCPLDGPG